MIDSQKRLFKGLGISTKNNIGVAPHVGAWIETYQFFDNIHQTLSHPMWVRGLKRRGHVATDTTDQSHLVHYFL